MMRTTKRPLLAFLAGLLAAPELLAQEASGEASLSAFDLLLKGGPVMIPLGICSVVALTVAFERVLGLSRRRVLPESFQDELRSSLDKSHGDVRKARDLCERDGSLYARVTAFTIDQWRERPRVVESAFAEAAGREVGRLRRSLRSLKTIASISPLLGLLGTVIGMIRAFQTVALSSGSLGRAEMLAQGIYEAMVTTATGLAIAIPTLIVYTYLNNRVDTYADELELAGNECCNLLQQHNPVEPVNGDLSHEEAA